LDRWAELRAVLQKGQAWGSPDKLKAVRLLGKQPLDAAPDAEVAAIFLACHVIEPMFPDPFGELLYELSDREKPGYRLWMDARQVEALRPPDADAARQVLLGIVRRATWRLEELRGRYENRSVDDLAERADRLSFDTSPEGERLRRHALSTSRVLLRTLDAFVKIRKSLDVDPDAQDVSVFDPAPAAAVECVGSDCGAVSQNRQNEPEPAVALPEPLATAAAVSPSPAERAIDEPSAVVELPGSEVATQKNEPEPAVAPIQAIAPQPVEPTADLPGAVVAPSSAWARNGQNEPEPELAWPSPTGAPEGAAWPEPAEPAFPERAAGTVGAEVADAERIALFSALAEQLSAQYEILEELERVGPFPNGRSRRSRRAPLAGALQTAPC
jgi:hypothetical protein